GAYDTSFVATVNVGLQRYAASWTVPVSDDIFYRISVWIGGVGTGIRLGFADVHTVPSPAQLKSVNQDQFIGQQDGSNLPIRFRIEIGALCDPPGRRPCDSATLQFTSGGSVSISTDGGKTLSGVTLPAQSQARQHTLTVQKCKDGDLNPRAIDLPTFGSCVTVKATPDLGTTPLNNPAIVQVCDLAGTLSAAGLVSEAQEHRITLHRLDGSTVQALPHVAGCAEFTGQRTPSIGSVLVELAQGHLKAAGGKLLEMLGPTPLNARRRRINLGGGGSTFGFSDFQFALPAKMDFYLGNGQTAPINSTLLIPPAVRVTDLGGDPVARATVHFATTDGSVGPASDTTDTDGNGIATTSWTLGATIGTQYMTASGRGIAGGNFDGPRCNFDPFQPIQLSPNPPEFGPASPCARGTSNGVAGLAVVLQEGTRIFTATGKKK
ncbi:MAG TPA: Ig-like domain-containing protein, partial [Gemmatimonadales bacterium]|nr:Ig-like domain-containing protein [Gemmatimonadales bacterium]